MISFSVGTNFDPQFIENIAALNVKYTNRTVTEIYGCLPNEKTSCQRKSYQQIKVTEKDLEEHIKLAHDLGFRFNYLYKLL